MTAIPIRKLKGPHVYFIKAGDAVKIGYSEVVGKRFSALQSGHAGELELLGAIPANGYTEHSYHERFAQFRIRGEWFRAEPELLSAIEADCSAAQVSDEAPDYPEMYKEFRTKTRKWFGPGTPPTIAYARTEVLSRLGQLAQNNLLPVHLDGYRDALVRFERLTS